MNVFSNRPDESGFAELIELKVELSRIRRHTKELRARLAAFGVPESELPELTDIRNACAVIGAALIRRCPCAAACAQAFRAEKTDALRH